MKTKEIAISYIKNMTNDEKQKLKAMLSHNVSCGRDFAVQNGIDPIIFNAELKNILKGGK
jgi:hypothetical protein